MLLSLRFAFLAVVLALPLQASAAGKAGTFVLERAEVSSAGDKPVRYEIGTLYVPENRTVPNSRTIGIGFVRIRAKTPGKAPPIFVLPGGPARSYLNAFTETDADAKSQLADLVLLTEAADVVVVDQRGYSRRGDVLLLAAPPQPLDRETTPASEAARFRELAAAAIAANPDKDLAGYTVVQCAEDVNDLRRALGYSRIALSGQSFGSQWSFAVMRLYPETVARAVLSGTEPLEKSFDMPSQIFAGMQRIAWEADRDPALLPYLPEGGLMAAVRAVRDRLAAAPVTVEVGTQKVTMGLADFQRSLLRPAAAWPAFVLSLYHGRYEEWAAETIERRQRTGAPVRLLEPLIDTSLGVSAEREHLLRTDPATAFLGTGDFDALIASADAWPTPDVGDAFRQPVQNPVPVLFLHGDWDTSTPVENMLGMLPYFTHARGIVVHRGAHHTRGPVFRQDPQLQRQVIRFFATGEFGNLPSEVTLPVPKFARPGFSPTR